MIIAIHNQNIALHGVTYQVSEGVFVELDSGTLDDAMALYASRPKVFIALTPRQIRQALTAMGLRALVDGAISTSSQDMKDWWEFSLTFERNHPMVVGMGQALDKTPAEIDALFQLGATL